MRNKGQMFLIAAAILVMVLVMLKTGVNLPDIAQRKREMEGRFEREFFINTVDELVRVIEISYYQPDNITKNVFDFGNFTRRKMTERLLDFEFLYVGSLANKTTNQINVTLINLLNKPINATLDLNGTVSTNCNSTVLLDGGSCSDNFSFNPGSTYVLTVSYNTTYSEEVTMETKSNKDVYIGFFDVTLIGSKTTHKDKFQKSYTLP